MYKRSYNIQLSYDVSDEEKYNAEKALLFFDHARKSLDHASDHLNILKTPFKDNQDITPEDVYKVRAALRRFRDRSIDNFNEFKSIAFKCVKIMQVFSSDTQTIKLIKSFISAVDDLENKVNKYVELFDDLKSKDFQKNIVSIIETIQKQKDDIEQIIEERINSHVQSNILAKTWVDSIGNKLDIELKKKVPLLLDLYNKRQEKLR